MNITPTFSVGAGHARPAAYKQQTVSGEKTKVEGRACPARDVKRITLLRATDGCDKNNRYNP